MRFEIAKPSPVPPFLRVFGIVHLLELAEDPLLIGVGDARPGITHGQHDLAVVRRSADLDLALIGHPDTTGSAFKLFAKASGSATIVAFIVSW
jgi:hypothetical protein